ncbi:hypothetical protein LJC42_00225 [Eubacteriales bacterium OttesenSCG-928-K08]|nr:hypothetical protein [Eubacteriales bacterium OttesenSCG-928-K08]
MIEFLWIPLSSGKLPVEYEQEVLVYTKDGFDLAVLQRNHAGRHWYGAKWKTIDFYSVTHWCMPSIPEGE